MFEQIDCRAGRQEILSEVEGLTRCLVSNVASARRPTIGVDFRTSFHRCAASLDRSPRLAAGSSLREGRFVRLSIGAEDR